MRRTRFIFRLVFFLLAIIVLVHLNTRTNEDTATIAEFKFKMFEKIKADSLDSKHKLDLLVNETTKFMDDSSRVREGIHYFRILFGLFVAAEVGFLILKKIKDGKIK